MVRHAGKAHVENDSIVRLGNQPNSQRAASQPTPLLASARGFTFDFGPSLAPNDETISWRNQNKNKILGYPRHDFLKSSFPNPIASESELDVPFSLLTSFLG